MDVRRAVIDATLDIVATGGPDDVSMREVARRAGVSHQAPYHYFGDRAGIFAAIAEEGFSVLAERLRAADGVSDTLMRQCLRAYVESALEQPGHFRVMFRNDINGLGTHETAGLAADEAYSALQHMVKASVGEDVSEHELMAWSTMLWSSAHGFATLILDGPLLVKMPADMSRAELIDRVVRLMTDMVEDHARRVGFVA